MSRIWDWFHVVMYDALGSQISIGEGLRMVSDHRRAGITLFSPCTLTTLDGGNITIGANVHMSGVAITSRKSTPSGDNSPITLDTMSQTAISAFTDHRKAGMPSSPPGPTR